jgi:hypothetical protein
VIARRRSPAEVEMSVEMTALSPSSELESRLCRGTRSALAICMRRAEVEVESRGVKRNLEQREARGSIILFVCIRQC